MACSSVFPPENSTIVFFKWESPVVELWKLVIIFVSNYLKTGR
jgi:hypothetical protein